MSELSEQDLKAIEALHSRWMQEELAGNATQTIALCTADVKWIPPDSPPLETKDAISKYLNASTVEVKDIQIKDLEVRGSDTVAYLIANYHSRFLIEGEAEPQESTGTHLWILRKESEGIWRVAVVAWSAWETTL
jgi:uncharacterized protein (TIGR02246 family)